MNHDYVVRISARDSFADNKADNEQNWNEKFEGHEKAIEIDKQLKNADGGSTDKVGKGGNNNWKVQKKSFHFCCFSPSMNLYIDIYIISSMYK